ncbi:unnamed protein product [Rhodiola kirilowii]
MQILLAVVDVETTLYLTPGQLLNKAKHSLLKCDTIVHMGIT